MTAGTATLTLTTPPAAEADSAGSRLSSTVDTLFAGGVARVQASIRADDPVLLAAAIRAGLRREGVLREADGPGTVLVGRLAGDVDPSVDALPTIAASMPRVLRASGWYITDPDARVLMVDPVYKPGLDLPGGVCDPGEDLCAAATRELAEELDLRLPVGDLLALDFCPDNGRRGDIELAIFDGGSHPVALADGLSFPDGELSRALWVHPDDLDGQAPEALVRRVRAVHRARVSGRLPGPTVLLYDGRPL